MARLRFLQTFRLLLPSSSLIPFFLSTFQQQHTSVTSIFYHNITWNQNTTTSKRDIYLLRFTPPALWLCRELASHLLTLQTPNTSKNHLLNHQTIRLYHHQSLALVSTLSTAALQITSFDLPIKTRLSLQTAFLTQEPAILIITSPSAKANSSITPITPGNRIIITSLCQES